MIAGGLAALYYAQKAGPHHAGGRPQGLRHRSNDGHAVGRPDRQRLRRRCAWSLPERAASPLWHLLIALDIAAFIVPDEFGTRMEELIERLKSTPLAAGTGEVLYPGELEARHWQQQLHEGLGLPRQTLTDLRAVGREAGVVDAFA